MIISPGDQIMRHHGHRLNREVASTRGNQASPTVSSEDVLWTGVWMMELPMEHSEYRKQSGVHATDHHISLCGAFWVSMLSTK